MSLNARNHPSHIGTISDAISCWTESIDENAIFFNPACLSVLKSSPRRPRVECTSSEYGGSVMTWSAADSVGRISRQSPNRSVQSPIISTLFAALIVSSRIIHAPKAVVGVGPRLTGTQARAASLSRSRRTRPRRRQPSPSADRRGWSRCRARRRSGPGRAARRSSGPTPDPREEPTRRS